MGSDIVEMAFTDADDTPIFLRCRIIPGLAPRSCPPDPGQPAEVELLSIYLGDGSAPTRKERLGAERWFGESREEILESGESP